MPISAGKYSGRFLGFAFSSSGVPVCTPVLVPPAGTSVVTDLDIQLEQGQWVGRTSASVAGTLVLNLSDAGGFERNGQTMVGTIRGWAVDLGFDPVPAKNVRMTVEGTSPDQPATIEGLVLNGGRFLSGDITGTIRFTDSTPAFGTCPWIQFTLNRYP